VKRAFGLGIAVMLIAAALGGCASAARDTAGFSVIEEATVEAPFEDTWQHTKAVLRERELNIFTRDKRGFFVAFTAEDRDWRLVPHRTKYALSLEEVSPTATKVTIETTDQVYGVTLLTFPDWHDRKTTDNAEGAAILEAIAAKVGNSS